MAAAMTTRPTSYLVLSPLLTTGFRKRSLSRAYFIAAIQTKMNISPKALRSALQSIAIHSLENKHNLLVNPFTHHQEVNLIKSHPFNVRYAKSLVWSNTIGIGTARIKPILNQSPQPKSSTNVNTEPTVPPHHCNCLTTLSSFINPTKKFITNDVIVNTNRTAAV